MKNNLIRKVFLTEFKNIMKIVNRRVLAVFSDFRKEFLRLMFFKNFQKNNRSAVLSAFSSGHTTRCDTSTKKQDSKMRCALWDGNLAILVLGAIMRFPERISSLFS